MPAPIYITINGKRAHLTAHARSAGIARQTLRARTQRLPEEKWLSPPMSARQAAMSNPDPFGWKRRRAEAGDYEAQP